MVTALAHGVAALLPVEGIDEALALKAQGYTAAAERDGQTAPGFDMGNSPFGFMHPRLRGQTIAFSTTNGTKAMVRSAAAAHILAGAFINLEAICQRLTALQLDTIIVCAGWKNMVNGEDTLFAGAVAHELRDTFRCANDATYLSENLYADNKANLKWYLRPTSHYNRLVGFGLERDIDFCLQHSIYSAVPHYDPSSGILAL